MSRALFRSMLELRATSARLSAPSSLLPIRARAFNTTAPIVEPFPERHPNNAANPTVHEPRPLAFKVSHPTPPPKPMDDSVKNLLPFLAAQPDHYITVHVHGFPYLVREGDQVRLPFRMPGVQPGDVLRLNRASILGSRDYTMKGAPHIDERVFECRAIVVGTESEPLRIKIKKKRRQRRMRQAKSKHRYTILRISELNINNVEDIE
ncbi:related to ribosomal protein YmL49 [Fusarium torulosum]|uniref:Large ribosomal subunit protein bL21m n=1 Tax=Fusarium torulosum TaxID=33205 RepID=A0AAE8MAZ6_9HYPO|nr:related to ribosomal protein YmL49 [Fusarium torulosum]